MWWVLFGLIVWTGAGLAVALLLGAMVRSADRQAVAHHAAVLDPAAAMLTGPRPTALERPARRRFPLPPIGVALVACATALMVAGYAVRLTGASGPAATLLSMDAPLSIPRMFVAGLFAVAAAAAFAGAARMPGRTAWWAAVGVVAALIAWVKAAGTLHTAALATAAEAVTPIGAVLASAALAGAVLGGLALLSWGERRDRTRVIGSLLLYTVAAVGLSAMSSVLAGAYGGTSRWVAAVTFVEETGEALSGVVFLVAVLVGVAPRLVLPQDWVLQREADAQSLELPEPDWAARRLGGNG